MECTRPSGKHRKKKVASPEGKTTKFNGSWIHATHAVSGSVAKCTLRNTYIVDTPLSAWTTAIPSMIHPIAFDGTRVASSVPMTANPIGKIRSTGSSSEKLPIADRFAIASAIAASQATSQKQATIHASFASAEDRRALGSRSAGSGASDVTFPASIPTILPPAPVAPEAA